MSANRIEQKVSDEQVHELRVRARRGESDASLAKAFGLAESFVASLRIGRARKRAGGPITKRSSRVTLMIRASRLEKRVARLEEEVTALRDALDAKVA